ncbi:MAG: serine/threonine protein kinase [Flavobacteriales bacterium]|nr:serine/threonine protein kinase [Flavobacteriales bacterium]
MNPEDAATLEVATREFAPDTVIDGRYRVLSVLGGGGMGAVYRVRHERMHKVMALKVLRSQLSRDPSVRARFHREAQALSHLESRHTVAVFDFGETPDGLLYLAMEHLKGRTLAAALVDGALAPERAVHILSQVLKSLEEAHGKGIVHRDIKPDNIFLLDGEERDLTKLIDFGIAKADAPAPAAARTGPSGGPLTQEDLLVGTPEYMAPEQARGQTVDARTDVWAVGVVLCECLTGRRPFRGETPIDVIMCILQDALETPQELKPGIQVPQPLWRVVEKALAKDPAGRFPSVRAMRDAMEAALKEGGIQRLPALKTNPGTTAAPLLDDDEEELAGRDEWARFMRAQRRRRAVLAVVMAGGLAGGGAWMAPQLMADPHVTEEREPNNGATEANLVAADSSIAGTLAVPVSGKGDQDYFVLQLPPGPQMLELDVETRGGPKANLGLTVWQDEKAMVQGFGSREPRHHIRHLVVEGRTVYVRVQERTPPRTCHPHPMTFPTG